MLTMNNTAAGRQPAAIAPSLEGDCMILMLRATDPAYSVEHRLCLLDEIAKRIGAIRAELIHEAMGTIIPEGRWPV